MIGNLNWNGGGDVKHEWIPVDVEITQSGKVVKAEATITIDKPFFIFAANYEDLIGTNGVSACLSSDDTSSKTGKGSLGITLTRQSDSVKIEVENADMAEDYPVKYFVLWE